MSTSIAMLGAGHADLAGGPTPLITPGLIFWYDARAITGLANDDSMVTWIDASGNGNTATLGTAPVYRTADLNSGPAVQGNGTSQHMLSGVAPSVAAGTMIAAFIATASSDYLMGSQDPGERCYLATSSDGYAGGGVGGHHYNSIEGTSSVTDGTPHVLIVTYDGSDVALYLDGALQDAQSQSDAPGSRDMALLAADNAGSIVQHFAGDVGQLLYYGSAASDDQARELSLYFTNIYGITTGLVRDHGTKKNWGVMTNMAPASDYSTTVPSGMVGNSVDFDGTDDHVLLGNIYTSGITSGEMSISAWINADSLASGYSSIIKKGTGGSVAWSLDVNDSYVRSYLGTDAGGESNSNAVSLSTGTWYHLMMVADGTNITIYVDGVAGSGEGYDGTIIGSSHDVAIGVSWEGSPVYFNGKIDEVKIWERALSSVEITAIVAHNTGSSDYPTDPANHWSFDHGTQ